MMAVSAANYLTDGMTLEEIRKTHAVLQLIAQSVQAKITLIPLLEAECAALEAAIKKAQAASAAAVNAQAGRSGTAESPPTPSSSVTSKAEIREECGKEEDSGKINT